MTITVHHRNTLKTVYEDVEGLTFYSGVDNNTGLPVARWTKYGEDRWPSEDFVNLDPSMITVRSVEMVNDQLCAFVG